MANDHGAEKRQERLSVDVVEIDSAVVRPSTRDVIDAVGKLASCSSRHDSKLREKRPAD